MSDFAQVLEYYGLCDRIISRDEGVMVLCPFHDDHRPSLSISFEKDVYYCFGCGVSGNVVRFVSEYEGVDEIRAQRILRKLRNGSDRRDSIERLYVTKKKKKGRDLVAYPVPLWELIWMDRMIDDLRYYPFTRGIKPETLYTWCVGWDYLEKALVFHVVYNGNFVGWQKRFVKGNVKYLTSPGLSRAGLYWAGEFVYVERGLPLILVEGPFDALAVYQFGFMNTGALLGSLNQKVIESIRTYTSGDIICAFDHDEVGQRYAEVLARNLGKVYQVDYSCWGGAKDVDELTFEQFIRSVERSNLVR